MDNIIWDHSLPVSGWISAWLIECIIPTYSSISALSLGLYHRNRSEDIETEQLKHKLRIREWQTLEEV